MVSYLSSHRFFPEESGADCQPLGIASGLSIGKEGPSVHVACSFGNIAARLFERYDRSHREASVFSAHLCTLTYSQNERDCYRV